MAALDDAFSGLFDNIFGVDPLGSFTLEEFIICIVAGLFVGAVIGLFYANHSDHTESFITTIIMIPSVVSVIIIVVNDSIGTGIAVVGAFALVRFRSVPGRAKEISAIFLSMGAGLLIGVGYIGYAILLTLIIGLFFHIFTRMTEGEENCCRVLNITIPEDLEFEGEFEDIFDRYTSEHSLRKLKTTNMGSMYRLTYGIVILPDISVKSMVDDIRCRNGNLEVSVVLDEKKEDLL